MRKISDLSCFWYLIVFQIGKWFRVGHILPMVHLAEIRFSNEWFNESVLQLGGLIKGVNDALLDLIEVNCWLWEI